MLDVRSCATLSEAAGILSGDRQALLIAGGTLAVSYTHLTLPTKA